MNIVSAVANLQKAHDYYKEELEEARAVIKQLTEGPGEIEYIHPFDLGDMFNASGNEESVELYNYGFNGRKDFHIIEIAKTGKKYKQSTLIPAKSRGLA